MKERDLRKWMRAVWGKDRLAWIEPSYGSSIGMPDTLLMFCGQWLPLELKIGEPANDGIHCKLRPAQIAFHHNAYKNGMKTAFVVGVDTPKGFNVYVAPGASCPKDNSGVMTMLYVGDETLVGANVNMTNKFLSAGFWYLERGSWKPSG